jgi:polysaccharide biosynthesis protein PslG
VWQIWSEPNLGLFWQPAPAPNQYAELLRLGENAVKAADPNAEVITGGVMPGRGENSIPQSEFLASLYQTPDVKDSFDGLALQPYVRKPRSVRRRVKKVRALTQLFGDGGVPLWLTEIGWSTKGPRDHYLVTSRRGQAKRLKRTYKILARMREPYGIRAATWFSYRDGWSQGYCDWCGGAGLLKKNRKPKPAWKRYAKLAGGKP